VFGEIIMSENRCWRCNAPENMLYNDIDGILKCFKCGYSQDKEKELAIQKFKDSLPDIIRHTSYSDWALKKRPKKRRNKNV